MKGYTWLYRWGGGTLLPSLSLVVLVWHGFHLGLAAPLGLALQWYESFVHFLFGWAEPYIRHMLGVISVMSGLHLHLFAHWRHIFILMWLYFAADAKTQWSADFKGTAVFQAVWGGIIALCAAATAGSVSLDSAAESIVPRLVLIVAPVFGYFVYQIGNGAWWATVDRHEGATWWHDFATGAERNLRILVVGLIAGISMAFLFRRFMPGAVPSPELTIVVLLFLVLVIYRLRRGVLMAMPAIRAGAPVRIALWNQGHWRVPAYVVVALANVAAFVFANAGLKLAGL